MNVCVYRKSAAFTVLLVNIIDELVIIALEIDMGVDVDSSLRMVSILFYVYVLKLNDIYVCQLLFNKVSTLVFNPSGNGIVNLSVS